MKSKVETKAGARIGSSGEVNGWRRVRAAVVALGLAAMLSGCGLFGCGGAASNGGYFGGCGAGMRF